MNPQAGDIWEYTSGKSFKDVRIRTAVVVVVEEAEWHNAWHCIDLSNGECNEWLFDEQCADNWRQLA
jgi:hypothetical protein